MSRLGPTGRWTVSVILGIALAVGCSGATEPSAGTIGPSPPPSQNRPRRRSLTSPVPVTRNRRADGLRRAIGSLQPGEIVLMHCGSNPTDHSTLDADALGRIIQTMRARGYSFVSLNALLQ